MQITKLLLLNHVVTCEDTRIFMNQHTSVPERQGFWFSVDVFHKHVMRSQLVQQTSTGGFVYILKLSLSFSLSISTPTTTTRMRQITLSRCHTDFIPRSNLFSAN